MNQSFFVVCFLLKAVRTGLEPATPCVTGMYSNQLNYRTNVFVCLSLDCGAKVDNIFNYTTVSHKYFTLD